ncbi:MAG: hypothetical protein ABIJ16_14535 [Bacteroidota bacterium]
MRKIVIKHCNHCPFFRYDESTYSAFCSESEYDEKERLIIQNFDFDKNVVIPDWCPLKSDEVVISLT